MIKKSTDIEVEVVEIDGIAPIPAQAQHVQNNNWKDWKQWQGQIRKLDSRWWPLWAFLGMILLGFLLIIGLIALLILQFIRIISQMFRGLLR